DEVRTGAIHTIEIPVPTAYWYRILRNPQISITPTARLFRNELEAECRARGLPLHGSAPGRVRKA
ncbi:MAG: hypothetical protein AB7K86_21540, partial [Rhodospirillales bacterium]